jgi:hypothetical protein
MVFIFRCGVLGVDSSRDFSVEGFQLLEAMLDLVPAKSTVTNDSRPFLVVITSADCIHSKVDSTRAAQSFSPRIITFTVIGRFLRCGFIAPVHAFVFEGGPSLSVNSEVAVFVGTSGFE